MKKILLIHLFSIPLYIFTNQSIIAQNQVLWEINNLEKIGGNDVIKYGNPKITNFGDFDAVEFDGIDDGILIDDSPLIGAESFTVEIIFMPYPGGLEEQRFLHIQQDDNNRMLIELRSTSDDQWFLDSFIKSQSSAVTLYAEAYPHTTNQWHHAALIYDNGTMTHYVDGNMEMSSPISYSTVTSGKTSFGVRQNKVSWFKGAIRLMKVTHKALTSDEFLSTDYVNGLKVADIEHNEPNPFILDQVIIKNDSYSKAIVDVKNPGEMEFGLINISGQKNILPIKQQVHSGKQSIPLNLEHLEPGIYILQASMDNYLQHKKIIIR